MNKLTRALCFSILSSFSYHLYAADIPYLDQQSGHFDMEMCIEDYTNDCIDEVCLTSSALDCQDQCKVVAKSKCEEMSEQ